MLKSDLFKLQGHELFHRFRVGGFRIARRIQNLLKILKRDLGLTIDVDDVSQFL